MVNPSPQATEPKRPHLPVHLPEGAWLDLAIIALLGFLFLAPVLVSPHFGLFSDYDQLLRWPAASLHNLPQFFRELRPLGDGRWTPMFHLETVAAYALLGPNAFLFFFVQGLTLILSLAMVYLLVRWMSAGSRPAGIAACLLILISAPLAENYFTLDKVEPRVVFLALVSIGYFAMRLASPGVPLWRATLLHFTLAVLLMFSKETGAFLAVAAFLVLCVTMLRSPRDSRMARESAAYFAATFSVLVLFLVLNYALVQGDAKVLRDQNGGLGRYLTYQISSRLVFANLMGYLGQMREVALGILLFGAGVLWTLVQRKRSWDAAQILLFLTGASGAIYLAGMLLWRFTLLYYMLPVVVFFAMASMAVVFRRKHTLRGWLFFLTLLFFGRVHFDQRLRTGFAVLAQDRAKDLIVQAIKKRASDRTRVAVGMFDVRSAEIGRSLEMYLAREGVHVAEGPPSEMGTRVYNLIEGPWVNFSDTERYEGSEAEPPTTQEMEQARALASPYVLWQYSPRREMQRVWWMNALSPGDLLALPVGTPGNISIPARGVSAFSASAEGTVATRFAGVGTKLLETAVVAFPLYKNEYLGWELYQVTEITPSAGSYAGLDHSISRPDPPDRDSKQTYLGRGWSPMGWTPAREPYRWGYNNAEIFAPRDSPVTLTLDLEPNGQLGLPLTIHALDLSGRELAAWPLRGRLKVELQVPKDATLTLRITDQIKVARDAICFRLFGLTAAAE